MCLRSYVMEWRVESIMSRGQQQQVHTECGHTSFEWWKQKQIGIPTHNECSAAVQRSLSMEWNTLYSTKWVTRLTFRMFALWSVITDYM